MPRRGVISTLLLTSALLIGVFPTSAIAASSAISVKGKHGEVLTVATTRLSTSASIKVSGAHFDETVGIYLAYCVLPPKGKVPTPCGGGINKTGASTSSYWISSNPPPYGQGLAVGFNPGGRFEKKLSISIKIGKTDCRIVKCAVTVRADHTREGDRSYDLFIPITFTK